jgi:hypothetical protein
MSEDDLFFGESRVLAQAEALVSAEPPLDPAGWADEHRNMAEAYRKLLNQTRTLIKIGDKMQQSLNDLNERLNAEIDLRVKIERDRECLVKDLETALAEVRALSGLLPICANCKKIRDEQGTWRPIETYISERSEAEFTHGICPECVKRLYPGMFDAD